MAIRRTIAEFSDDIATADIADDAITGGKLANDIAISTTGNIATTGSGTVTSAGLVTAPSLVLTPGSAPATTEGAIYYNSTTDSYEIYVGTKWEIITTGLIVEFLVIGAGGGGTQSGGGAGGYRLGSSTLSENSGGNSIREDTLKLLKGTNYTVTIGAGGGTNTNGSSSQFASIISYGGGGTGGQGTINGSGHGAVGVLERLPGSAGTAGQGCSGGFVGVNTGSYRAGGGGGGAASGGGNGISGDSSTYGGNGGKGITSSITGSAVGRGGGGGGATLNGSANPGTGGDGGGAGGTGGTGASGTVNTGGGGGGSGTGGSGGSGLVVISYLNTYPNLATIHTSHVCNGQSAGGTTAPAASTSRSGYKTYSFTVGDGNISW